MTDKSEDELQGEAKHEQPNYTPYVKRKRIWNVPRVALMGLGIIGLVTGLYALFVVNDASEGPTLDARVQRQQQAIEELRSRVAALQSNQDAQASARGDLMSQLDMLTERVDEQVRYRQMPERRSLPDDVEALSERLDTFSSSVDVRFSASQEKAQGLENALEEMRKHQATQEAKKASTQRGSSSAKERKPSPSFTLTGLEVRGGHRYIGIIERGEGAGRLSDIRLIGEGQRVGGWRVSSIGDHSVLFVVGGQNVTIPIP